MFVKMISFAPVYCVVVIGSFNDITLQCNALDHCEFKIMFIFIINRQTKVFIITQVNIFELKLYYGAIINENLFVRKKKRRKKYQKIILIQKERRAKKSNQRLFERETILFDFKPIQ